MIVVLPAPEGDDSTSRKPRRRRGRGVGRAHSRFCTCSRNCSIAALSARPMRVSSISADFEHSVLASRFSSWHRKSSWRPMPVALALQQFAGLRDMRAQPVELLADIGARRRAAPAPARRVPRGIAGARLGELGEQIAAAARAAPRAAPRPMPPPRATSSASSASWLVSTAPSRAPFLAARRGQPVERHAPAVDHAQRGAPRRRRPARPRPSR